MRYWPLMCLPCTPSRSHLSPWGVVALTLVVCSPSSVNAQDAEAVAQHHYDEGRRFFLDGQYDEALEHFRVSLETYDSPNSRLYVARSLRELGRVVEAVAEYERAMRVANDAAQTTPRYQEASAAARRELNELAQQIARLTVIVEPMEADCSITVGARSLPSSAVGVPLPVEPGQTTVRVTAPGYGAAEEQLSLNAGESSTVTLVLTPIAEPHSDVSTQPEDPTVLNPEPSSGRSNLRALVVTGWSSLALGVVGGVLFAGFGGAAQARFNELQEQCDGHCSGAQLPSIDEGRRFELVANVSLGVGIVLAVTGAALLIVETLLSRRRAANNVQ